MARARNIKPGFFTNGDLADCQPLARLLFIGLWGICDREGRLIDKPRDIKAKVLPFDDCQIEVLLEELNKTGFIRRYSAETQTGEIIKLIWVIHFKKHQHVHKDEIASQLPEFIEAQRKPEKTGEPPPILNAERGMLNDELLNDESATEVAVPVKTKAKRNANPKTRLTEWLEASGGYPPASLGEWANESLGWDSERISREWEAFADYWNSGDAVDGGRKADWPATWRGHCRRQAERFPSQQRGAGGSKPSKLASISSAVMAGMLAKQGNHGAESGTHTGTGSSNEAGNGHDLQIVDADLPEWAR